MSGKSAISLAVKVSEDKDGWRTLTMDADGLRKTMTEDVKVAKELQSNSDLLAQGLCQTISNGVPEDNWMNFLQT